MARIFLATALLVASATAAHADTGPTETTSALADEAGLDALDLQGAVNALGLTTEAEIRGYLYDTGALSRPRPAESGQAARVRITYYTLNGRTYSGGTTYPGSTACSWNFALGTRFMLPDGEVVVCNDRGLLGGAPGWLDIWGRPDLAHRYEPYVTVKVLP